ncbi:MAG: FAD-dependent monooxygenase [Gammaproteobacteria bacterium]|nr:FAD-dependent monooxygenase [Gammaproteobacteria bacterium]
MRPEYDVAIVGGGLAGAGAACALADSPLRILLLESSAERPAAEETRGLALSLASQRIFEAWGLWGEMAAAAAPIRRVHVSEYGRFGAVRLSAGDIGAAALGYVLDANLLLKRMWRRLEGGRAVEILRPARLVRVDSAAGGLALAVRCGERSLQLRARLLVAADGSHSQTCRLAGIPWRVRDYGQTAIVSEIATWRPHRGSAYERFTAEGPLAVLPLASGKCKLVHTVAARRRQEILDLSDRDYRELAGRLLGWRLGPVRAAGPRKAYPLYRRSVLRQTGERLLILGDAAYALHPNVAQGFNLCLRDAQALGELLARCPDDDPGSPFLLHRYCDLRRRDRRRAQRLSDGIAGLFYTRRRFPAVARRLAMLLLELAPPLRRGLITRASGLAGGQPLAVWERGR